MPHEGMNQLEPPTGPVISVPLSEVDTDDLVAMDANLKSLIEYRVWPESRQTFEAARKSIGQELLHRSI